MFKQNLIKYILIRLVCLVFVTTILSGCSWMQIFSTATEVIENYPSDNPIEEEVEEYLEEFFDLPEDYLDLSMFSPEEE